MTIVDRTRQFVGAEPSQALRAAPLALLAVDTVMIALGVALAAWGREELHLFPPPEGAQEILGPVALVAIPLGMLAIAVTGGYSREVLGAGADEFRNVFRGCLLAAGTVGVGCYLAKFDFSRGFFLLTFLVGSVLLLGGRLFLRRALQRARRQGRLQVRVLVAGTPERIDDVSRVLGRESWLGYSVVGCTTTERADSPETPHGVPVLGSTDELVDVACRNGTDLVFLTGGVTANADEVRELVWALEPHGINLVVAPSLVDVAHDRMTVRPVGGVPLIHVDQPRWTDAGRFGKRTFDVLGSAFLLAVLSPLFLFVALRIRIDDGGPVLFRQLRTGRHGVEFACLKFRTMVTDAEARIAALQQETGQSALLFKMKDDPRITRPGKWLRRLSVDELPQLINVLKGDMSLVGPRPQVRAEVDEYRGGMVRRLLVRPGMTGLWQVSGRNDLTPAEAMRLDLYYVDNWSMFQDLAILTRTASAVVSSRGAY